MFRFPTAVWAAMAGVSLALAAHSAPAQEPDLIEQIRAAWRARQEKVKSFDAKWQMLIPTPKGHHGTDAHGAPIPPEDLTLAIDFRLVSDGKKIKCTRSGVDWDESTRQFIRKEFVKVDTGTEIRETWQADRSEKRPFGCLYRHGEFDDGRDWKIQPPIHSAFPLNHHWGTPDVALFIPTGKQAVHRGVPCSEWEARPENGLILRLYLAADDHRLVRRVTEARSVPVYEIDIDYGTRDPLGLVATGWTYIKRYHNGNVAETRIVPAIEWRFNVAIPPAELDYEFPPGTVVSDEETKTGFIVRRDGSYRPFVSSELAPGMTYDDLMDTPPAKEAVRRQAGPGWRNYGWYVGVIVLAALVVFIVRQRMAAR